MTRKEMLVMQLRCVTGDAELRVGQKKETTTQRKGRIGKSSQCLARQYLGLHHRRADVKEAEYRLIQRCSSCRCSHRYGDLSLFLTLIHRVVQELRVSGELSLETIRLKHGLVCTRS